MYIEILTNQPKQKAESDHRSFHRDGINAILNPIRHGYELITPHDRIVYLKKD